MGQANAASLFSSPRAASLHVCLADAPAFLRGMVFLENRHALFLSYL
jgi:hypothetical protein